MATQASQRNKMRGGGGGGGGMMQHAASSSNSMEVSTSRDIPNEGSATSYCASREWEGVRVPDSVNIRAVSLMNKTNFIMHIYESCV
jgi:hypothetical protein